MPLSQALFLTITGDHYCFKTLSRPKNLGLPNLEYSISDLQSMQVKYIMGCGASKRTTVAPVEELATESESPNKQTRIRRSSDVIAVHGDDIPAEELREAKPPSSIAQPMAFEVPVNEESIIRKHPPKRLQRLEDQQTLTHELLDEKQAEAEQRRLQILTQRIQSAKQSRPRRPFLTDGEESPTEMIETIKRENSTVEL